MEQYVLLAEIQNTLFFYHANQEYSKKENSYNIYRALEHIKLIENNETIVIIFNALSDDTMDIIIIQHKDSLNIKQLDKNNLEDMFNYLKIIDTPRNIFMMYYYNDKDTYETTIVNGILPYIKPKMVEAIEYVEFQGDNISETIEQTIIEDGNLNQPMKLDEHNVEDDVEETVVEEPTVVEAAVEETGVEAVEEEPGVEAVVEEPTAVEAAVVEEPGVQPLPELNIKIKSRFRKYIIDK